MPPLYRYIFFEWGYGRTGGQQLLPFNKVALTSRQARSQSGNNMRGGASDGHYYWSSACGLSVLVVIFYNKYQQQQSCNFPPLSQSYTMITSHTVSVIGQMFSTQNKREYRSIPRLYFQNTEASKIVKKGPTINFPGKSL